MNDLLENLKSEFQNEEYRYAYAQSFLNTKLATQIKTLREQRSKTQAEVAALMGIKQPGYRRFEDVNHSVWKTDSLWDIARAYGVRLNISFETFGTLPDEKKRFKKEALQLPEFKNDPVFNEPLQAEQAASAKALAMAVMKPPGVARQVQQGAWAARLQLAQDSLRMGALFPELFKTLQQLGMAKAIAARSTESSLVAQQPFAAPDDSAKSQYGKILLFPKQQVQAVKAENPPNAFFEAAA